MASYVYQTTVGYRPVREVLGVIRDTVRNLKENNPELDSCSLADVSMQRREEEIAVTLYFHEKSS